MEDSFVTGEVSCRRRGVLPLSHSTLETVPKERVNLGTCPHECVADSVGLHRQPWPHEVPIAGSTNRV